MLSLFRPAPHDDPHLGRLDRLSGRWRGRISLPTHGEVPLALSGGRSGPDGSSLRLAHDLPARYPSLLPTIQNSLFEHYEPYAESAEDSATMPRLTNDASLWRHARPAGVLIEPLSAALTIEIAYQVAWDEEHTLGARIRDWVLVELNGSIHNIF